MFESTQYLLQLYTNLAFRNERPFSQDHVTELRERLAQLDYLQARIQEREEIQRIKGLDEPVAGLNNFQELKLYVESFYYMAFRVRQVLRNADLPGLKSFECAGVRDVRNNLIEHCEGKLGVVNQSMGFDPERGLMLKVGRRPGQEHKFEDSGFRSNCAEFKEELEKVLRSAARET